MKNRISKFLKWANQHKGVTIFLTLAVIIVGGALINLTPRPLGNSLDYLGRENYGNIFGFDVYPGAIYYYATDLSLDEMKHYFKDVSVETLPPSSTAYSEVNYTHDNKTFYITYYTDKSEVPFTTDKKAVVTIDGKEYRHAIFLLK